MTDVDAAAVALVVLVLASGCIAPSAAAPESSTKTVATTTTAPTASTTTAPATTTAPNRTEKWDNQTHVEIQTAVLRNETWEELGIEVPAKAVDIWISTYASGDPTFAFATNCTSYRAPVDIPQYSWTIATDGSHNISEWDFVQVARIDTGEVIARHDLNDDGPSCSPPLPETESDSSA